MAVTNSGTPSAASPERVSTPARRVAALGLPLMLGALSESASGVVDTAMMGHYGTDDAAAVAGASAVFDLFASVVLATAVAYQILAARFAGRDDPPGIRRSLRSSVWFCGGIAAALTATSVVAGGWLTGLVSGHQSSLSHIGAEYLVARGPTLLLLVPFTLLAATFNAYERPLFATVAAVVVNLANLVLDALLIFGPGPLPRLGALGNGLATTSAWALGVAYLVMAARRFGLPALLRQPGPGTPVDFVASVPKLSWPVMASMAVDYASLLAFFAIVGSLGAAALGGSRIAFELMVLLFVTGSSFAAGARILVGRSLGAGAVDDARTFWRVGQRLVVLPALLAGLVLVAGPRWVALAFTSLPPLVGAATEAIPLIGVSLPFLAWSLGNANVLRALGLTRQDMVTNLVPVLCIQLPLGWLLTQVAHLGVAGAYLGVVGYWVARASSTEIVARRAMAREAARTTGRSHEDLSR